MVTSRSRIHITRGLRLMQPSRTTITIFAALLLGALPLVAAHGNEHTQMKEHTQPPNSATAQEAVPNYFRHPHQAGWMYTHITLMIISWGVVLPPALVLSFARSRYRLPAQIVFHGVNGLGLLAGLVYNHATPDLYVSNSHHPIGWVATSLALLWTITSLATALVSSKAKGGSGHTALRTCSPDRTEPSDYEHYIDSPSTYRFSNDSGNFSGGSRANSSDSIFEKNYTSPLRDVHAHQDEGREIGAETSGFLRRRTMGGMFSRIARHKLTARILPAVRVIEVVLEKPLLLLGFVAMTSGFVVYSGLFRDREIYSGLAHYVKGAIFFWYGLLTLGRWMGAFAEFGWAWNVRPRHSQAAKWKSRVPSAEFTESFVIWFYGASNVFLEHLNNWGGKWSPQDFEHVSITILFFGGGLLGMMTESRALRKLASGPGPRQSVFEDNVRDTSGFQIISEDSGHFAQLGRQSSQHRISLNPMPALTIMFLGMMMSGHHQSSMVSTMMHAQWGMLFTGFAMARAVTYIMLYIKPPTSQYPSRPPSELVAAFCLTAGGIMFMNSAHDSVKAIEDNGLDAMTIFTLTIGLTGVIMAWELVSYTIKGWAVREEQQRGLH